MNSKAFVLPSFLLVCLLQWAVPASMVHRREATLRLGVAYPFKTAPVDPYDAFRGRYVALNFEQRTVPGRWDARDYTRGRVAYARLGLDDEGYANITDVLLSPPAEGDFLKVRVHYAYDNGSQLVLHLPFDRFYMEESEAPEAERRVMRLGRDRQEHPAYALVRVRKGFAVLENVFVDGKAIRDWLVDGQEPL